jgi:hypothetical protein
MLGVNRRAVCGLGINAFAAYDLDRPVCMASIQKFDLREWLVGPILVSISLGLMIAGAVIIRW